MAVSNGCKEPQYPISKWPLKLGNIFAVLKAANEGHFMKYLSMKIEEIGITRVERFLWFRTISTVDPANIEAILSSQFKGWSALTAIAWQSERLIPCAPKISS